MFRSMRHSPILILLLIIYVGLAFTYNRTIPIGEGADEVHHFRVIRFIRDEGRLPNPLETYEGYQPIVMGHHPPVYYGLMATLCTWCNFTDGETFLPYNPHFVWSPNQFENGASVHLRPEPELGLFYNASGAVRWLRYISALIGGLTVYATYLLGRAVFPQEEWIPLLGAGITATNPTLLGISATLHNDILVTLFITLALLWMVRYVDPIQHPQARRAGRLLLIGGLLAAAILTKLTGLILAPLVGITLLYDGWQQKRWQPMLRNGLILLGTVIVLAGWWYGRNILLFGSPLPLSDVMQQLFPHVYRTEAYGWGLFRAEFLQQSYETFWGAFGYNHVLLPRTWVTPLWIGLSSILVLGVLTTWLDRRRSKDHRLSGSAVTIQFALLMLTILLIFLSVAQLSISMRGAGQARYYMPALPPLAILTAYSISTIVGFVQSSVTTGGKTPSWPTSTAHIGLLALCFVLPVATIFEVLQPAYAPLEMTKMPPPDISYLPSLENGSGTIKLIGYELTPPLAPDFESEFVLYWMIGQEISRDLKLFGTLNDRMGSTVWHESFWPHPNSSTQVWQPDMTYVTRHSITPIGAAVYGPATLELRLASDKGEAGIEPELQIEIPIPINGWTRRQVDPQAVQQLDLSSVGPVSFGESIKLQGVSTTLTRSSDGVSLAVDLEWESTQPLAEDLTVFVHILDQNGRLIAQRDTPPLDGKLPTSVWPQNTPIIDQHKLTLPANQEDLTLLIGLYRWPSLERLPAAQRSTAIGDALEITLSTE